jgi:hypothetical protein
VIETLEIDVVIERLKNYIKIENKLTKCVKLNEKVDFFYFFFDELGFARYCVKQGDAFHVMIKTLYQQMPIEPYFVEITPLIVQHGKNN